MTITEGACGSHSPAGAVHDDCHCSWCVQGMTGAHA